VFKATSPMLMLVQHINNVPEPPSKFTELDVPPALDELILSCLEKEQADRPVSAEELDARLGSIDLGGSWSSDRARQWWERHRPRRVAPTPSEEALPRVVKV